MTGDHEPRLVDAVGAQQPSPAGRLPEAYVVGHGKSGTTAMYVMLANHPQIFVGLKEPRFFVPEMNVRDIPRPGGTPKTMQEYMAWFARAKPEQLVVDVSPWYLWSPSAAQLIAEARPDARIIAILREPASFLRSLHLQWLQLYVESEPDFRKAMELEPARREGRRIPSNTYWPKALLYSDHVRYADQLRRYRDVFAPEQMLVLIYDDFRADNEGTMRSILRFLGVDDTVPVTPRESNPSVQVRARRSHGLMRSLSVANDPLTRTLKSTIKTLTPARRATVRSTPRARRSCSESPSRPTRSSSTSCACASRARSKRSASTSGETSSRCGVTTPWADRPREGDRRVTRRGPAWSASAGSRR